MQGLKEYTSASEIFDDAAVRHRKFFPPPRLVEPPVAALVDPVKSLPPAKDRAPDKPSPPSIAYIQAVAVRYFGLTKEAFLSPDRSGPLVRARQITMYLARKIAKRSLPEIGRRFGGRDHSTVVHAIRKVERLMDTDPAWAEDVAKLESKLSVSA